MAQYKTCRFAGACTVIANLFFLNDSDEINERFERRVDVRWSGRLIGSDGGDLEVDVVDVSATGAAVAGNGELAVGQQVTLVVQPPTVTGPPATALWRFGARVVYLDRQGPILRAGLQFGTVASDQQESFQAWLDRARC